MEGWRGESEGEKRGMNRNTHWDPAVHSSRCKGREGVMEGGVTEGGPRLVLWKGEREHVKGGVGVGGNIWVAFTESNSMPISQ